MKLKHIDLVINPDNPFENCKLERKQYADILTSIIQIDNGGFVLAINNEWGTGKTTFIKMWEQSLKKEAFITSYFNAWENDYNCDALIALMSELKTLVTDKTNETFTTVIERATPIAKKIGPALLKSLIGKYLGEGITKELFDASIDGLSDLVEKEIENYNKKKESIKDFRDSLTNFIKETSPDKPVILFIDELDRCRPNYAVEILEKIKHLFSVEGIVFVLSIDKVQLAHAVRGVYGSENINADEYLRRFIDVEYSLPEPDTKVFLNYLFGYYKFDSFFYSGREKNFDFVSDDKTFFNVASTLFEKSKLTLRQQEKLFAQARLSLLLFNENSILLPEVFLFLIYIKNYNSVFYNQIKLKRFTVQEFISEIENIFPKGIEDNKIRVFIVIEAFLTILYDKFLVENHGRLSTIIDKKDGKETIKVFSKIDKSQDNQEFHSLITNYKDRYSFASININYLFNKIDLSDNIKSK